MNRRICIDCGVNTSDIKEYYMVQWDLWEKYVPEDNHNSMLCLGCLESRMGRQLVPNDFIACILNDDEYFDNKSDRFLNRLLGEVIV